METRTQKCLPQQLATMTKRAVFQARFCNTQPDKKMTLTQRLRPLGHPIVIDRDGIRTRALSNCGTLACTHACLWSDMPFMERCLYIYAATKAVQRGPVYCLSWKGGLGVVPCLWSRLTGQV
jgi:hypothetical protein